MVGGEEVLWFPSGSSNKTGWVQSGAAGTEMFLDPDEKKKFSFTEAPLSFLTVEFISFYWNKNE